MASGAFKKGPITTAPKIHLCVYCGKPAVRKLRDPHWAGRSGYRWTCMDCYNARDMDN